MAKKKQKKYTSNSNNPKILFIIVLMLLLCLLGYLIISSTSNKKITTNPNENPINYDYGGSNITTENGISTYKFDEFGHGYSFSYPATWKLKQGMKGSATSMSSLTQGDDILISFGFSPKPQEIPNDIPVDYLSIQNLTINGYPAELKASESKYEFYGYDNRLTVLDVIFGKRITSKEVKDIEGVFVMQLSSDNPDKAFQAKINEEFRKVYETLKFH